MIFSAIQKKTKTIFYKIHQIVLPKIPYNPKHGIVSLGLQETFFLLYCHVCFYRIHNSLPHEVSLTAKERVKGMLMGHLNDSSRREAGR